MSHHDKHMLDAPPPRSTPVRASRVWGLLVATLGLVGCATPSPRAPAVPFAQARVNVGVRKPLFFLGENVLVDFCVVNTGRVRLMIMIDGDVRGFRNDRFQIRVLDRSGARKPDPAADAETIVVSLVPTEAIASGTKWCQSLPLMRYARIDAPGTYTIYATRDLGFPIGTTPRGKTTVTFVAPDEAQAERVVAEMEALPTRAPDHAIGALSADYADFSALRYPVYGPPLASWAQRGELHAIEGLGTVPTEYATRALVGLLGDARPGVACAAARALAPRLPHPLARGVFAPPHLIDPWWAAQARSGSRAWVPALANTVRAAAPALAAAGCR